MAEGSTSTWRQLLNSANAGELLLDENVGNGLAQDCDRHLESLRDILLVARRVELVSGFGGFPSGQVLEEKFSLKGSTGADSIQTRIKEHIDEVMLMKEVFEKAIENFRSVDQSNSDKIAGIDIPS
ncbi:hypothetical protein IU459_17800 [Nocardia amamiensis]|uniref:Uncharacterized protein n=1 Tax=Nocardia amamiensis TaxID=404578 RepID=A0ABS0CRZ5_9NOCA|nr:hypothetical protein [Nocardia amamiensis]MBF6299382.1 hypothetical protein [Nocardia amamiensis]